MPAVLFGADAVRFDAFRVLFGDAPTVGVSAYHLFRNGVEITPKSEWTATWSEIVGGVGEASVVVQNRDGVPDLDFHVPGFGTRDIMKMTFGPGDASDWVLFEGELITPDLDLPVGFPWRRWKLALTDWNTVPDLRLINVPDGQNWLVAAGGDADLSSSDPNGPHPIDPDAIPGSTDKVTIDNWYDAKVRAPDGGAFDSTTYVGEYVPNSVLNDAVTGEPNYVPARGSVKGAIEGLSALAALPVSDWIDPDRKVHHVSFDVPDSALMPPAPLEITDVRAEWDGVTKIGGRGLHITPDFGGSIEEAYVDGVTDFLRLATDDPDVGVFGPGRDLIQGTGWGHSTPASAAHTKSKRQGIVSGQSVTVTQRDALADAYTGYATPPRYRGQITCGGRDDEGNGLPIVVGFRGGQLLTITDERLPDDLNGIAWPIQAIRGSLVAGRASVLQYTFEFGNQPVGQFSAMLAQREDWLERRRRLRSTGNAKPAPKHNIYFQTLNPKPGETQTLVSQARGNDDLPVAVKGIPVVWSFVSVTDHLGADLSGNGESLSPTDTVTDENGQSRTTFTAGTETDTYYQIVATSPYQP